MTLQDLNCFIIVAETLSYTQTAQRMFISQPAVTKHIAALEKEYKVSLINRSNRRQISLTEAGKILYEGLKTGQEAYLTALNRLKAFSLEAPITTNLPKGITLPFSYVEKFNLFAEQIRPTRVSIDYCNASEFAQCLENGELLICQAEAVPKDKKYRTQLLCDNVPLYLLASSDHPIVLEKGSPTPEDFIGNPVLLSKKTPLPLQEKCLTYLTKLYGGPPEVSYAETLESVALYLHGNREITVCSEWHGMFADENKYHVRIPLYSSFVLVWDPDKFVNSQLDELRKLLK